MSDNGFRKRLVCCPAALLVAAAGIALRLTLLQAVGSEAYAVRARDQHEGKVQIEGRRGTITDRNGRELAVSIETKSAYVHPCQIPSAAVKERIITRSPARSAVRPTRSARCSTIPGTPSSCPQAAHVAPRVPGPPGGGERAEAPRDRLDDDTRRFYPRGRLRRTLLGFVDIDGKGQAGIERAFDDVVPRRADDLPVARRRAPAPSADALRRRPGRSGKDVRLTIDEVIQNPRRHELDRAMDETRRRARARSSSWTRRRARSSRSRTAPGFDPNAPGASPGSSRENIAVSYGYEPGSTFKVLTAAAALEEGRARPSDLFDCGMGSITLYGRRIGDHHSYGTLR
jgi:cell division protein FtsI/penicillin-binding protein 2